MMDMSTQKLQFRSPSSVSLGCSTKMTRLRSMLAPPSRQEKKKKKQFRRKVGEGKPNGEQLHALAMAIRRELAEAPELDLRL